MDPNLEAAIARVNALSEPSEAERRPLTLWNFVWVLLRYLARRPKIRSDSAASVGLIAEIVPAYRSAETDVRRKIASSLSAHTSNALIGFAAKMAVEAVNQNTPELVSRGLVALAIDGGRVDLRDGIVAMALLHHTAVKLGTDTQRVFAEAAISTSEEMNTAMRTFPLRKEEDRDIRAAFLHREKVTRKGFRYQFCGSDYFGMIRRASAERSRRKSDQP